MILAFCGLSRASFAAEESSPDAPKPPAASRKAPAEDPGSQPGDPEPPATGRKPSGGAKTPPSKKAAGGTGAKAPAPPPTVRLPAAGEKKCPEILALAGTLHGRPVLAEDPEVKDARITVTKAMAGQAVSREEFAILLGAHGLQIVEKQGRGGKLFLAARKAGQAAHLRGLHAVSAVLSTDLERDTPLLHQDSVRR